MYVLTYNALAKAWDVLVATEREVSEVKQDIVLTYSSIDVVDDR
jgi:hypothetical protein